MNEALATGLPCIVSDRVGCAPDLVDETTGRAYPAGNVTALADAIEKVRAAILAGYDYAPGCRARAADYGFDEATRGLMAACKGVLTPLRAPDPRIVAWCGHMVAAGGMERITFEGLHAVTRGGGHVHCIVNDWDSSRIVKMANGIGATWSTTKYRESISRRLTTVAALARLLAEIVTTSADLLRWRSRIGATHVFFPDYVAIIRNAPAAAWLRIRGLPLILRLGNAPEPGRFYRTVWRRLVNPLVDTFVCNSRFTESVVLEYGIPARKVRVIRNTIPSRPAGAPTAAGQRTDIIYVGQIIPEKGVHMLLEAVSLLASGGLEVTLEIVGEIHGWVSQRYAGYREAVLERAQAPDLEHRARFLGYREDVPALMAAARVHCCPSLPEQREAFGIVVLEAKAAAIPSVVFGTGALPELIRTREDGWVCRECTPAALAEGLRYFLSDPARLLAAGVSAKSSLAPDDGARFAAEWRGLFGSSADPAPAALSGPRREI